MRAVFFWRISVLPQTAAAQQQLHEMNDNFTTECFADESFSVTPQFSHMAKIQLILRQFCRDKTRPEVKCKNPRRQRSEKSADKNAI